MSKGIDRGAPIKANEALLLADHGYTFAVRYLSDIKWKRLTKAEVKRLNAAGLYVACVFQNANNCREVFAAVRGATHAKSAVRQAEALGMPKGLPPIYFAVDYQASAAEDMAAVCAYFRAIVPIMRAANYPVGVYGSYSVCQYVTAQVPGVAFTFQTVAWSDHKKLPSPSLYQKACDVPLPEYPRFGKVDLVDSNGAGGGWKIAKEVGALG